MSMDRVVAVSTIVFALATVAAGRVHSFPALALVLFLGGVGWIAILACLNVTAQTMSPSWVLARSLSMYVLVLQGGLAGGSALFGALADREGVANALLYSAILLMAGLVTMRWHRLRAREADLARFADTGITHG